MMGKVGIAFPNRFDGASVSGGLWTAAMPATRLLTKQIADACRSLNVRARSTWLWAAFSEDKAVGLLGLVGTNISTNGTARLRGYTTDPRPTLDLDFTSGTLDSRVTFSRSTVATYIDRNGVLQTAGTNEPRFEWSNGVCLGLLIEELRSNLCLHSSDLTQAAWTKSSVTTSKTATGPDGQANSATICTATANNATVLQSITSASAARATSAWVRRRTGSGVIEMTQNGGALWTAVTLSSGWTRVNIPSATVTNPQVGLRIGTLGDAIEVAYFQIENGSEPTSAIQTGGTGQTRSRDVAQMTGANFTSWFNPAGGTFTAAARFIGTATGAVFTAQQDASNFTSLQFTSAGVLNLRVFVGGGTQAQIPSAAVTAGTLYRVSAAFAQNDFAASLDGAAPATDNSGSLPAPVSLLIGGLGSASMTGIIERLSFHPARRSNADLQALATDDWSVVPDYDSGAFDAWDATYLSSTTAEEREGLRNTPTFQPTTPQTYQYWRVDISDTSNADGYIEMGRVFMGSLWQPGINMVYGASLHYEPRDEMTETRSGAEYFDERDGYRVARFRLQAATEGEAVLTIQRMQRQLGLSGELFFVWDDDDTTYKPERTFLGRMRSVSPITAARWSEFEAEFDIKELL